jgi:hypothetical protein
MHAYDNVLNGSTEPRVRDRYRREIAVDTAVLGAFSITFLGLAMRALKQKDML